MTIELRRNLVGLLAILFLGSLVAVTLIDARRHQTEEGKLPPVVPTDSRSCVDCHTKVTPQVVAGWAASNHGKKGIACMACHAATKGSPNGFVHHRAFITMVVTPKLCGSCHKGQAEEFAKTSHGMPIAGHEIKFDEGKPDPKNWPMSPIGRINPDGSAGTCTICHARHNFQAENARSPAVCMSCHLADGSAVAWQHSPHGVAFRERPELHDLKQPTCVTCHMAATVSGGATHDVTSRVTWQTGPDGKLSQRPAAADRRDVMSDTCYQCHSNSLIEDAFGQIDRTFKEAKPSSHFPEGLRHLEMPAAWPHLSPFERGILLRRSL